MDYYHLTTPQQNIWNLQKYYEGTAISNLCGAIFYNEKRSSNLLKLAICHLVADAWTFGLMANEVDAAYHKLVGGEAATLAGADYVDYIQSEADYLTSNRYVKDKSFLKKIEAFCKV